MKKILVLSATIVVVLGTLYGFFALYGTESEMPPAGIDLPILPGTNGDPATSKAIPVRTATGKTMQVRDFRNDQFVEAIADNNYILRDTDSPSTATFEILYSGNDGGIIVSLREEPLRDTRRIAEEALMQHLLVSREQLCALAISIGAARDVNEFYAGEELGVSNCPGSKQL